MNLYPRYSTQTAVMTPLLPRKFRNARNIFMVKN